MKGMNGDRYVQKDLRELERALDAYGADPQRWPEERRAHLMALISASSEARCMCDEAAALDRLLDASRAKDEVVPLALMTRIMAEVQSDGDECSAKNGGDARTGQRSAEIVTIGEVAARRNTSATGSSGNKEGAARLRRLPAGDGNWASMAMLAASLVLGIYIGGTGQLDVAFERIGVVSGQPSASEDATAFLVPMLDGDDVVGEDFL
jgi:hypothetical protein